MKNDIVKQMRDLMPTFSKGQKKIANAILSDYNGTAYLTAAKLASMVGVSESTVVRFATELGFKGYPEFQKAIQKSISTKMTSNQRISAAEQHFAGGDILKSVMTSDIERIKHTLENIDRNVFDNVVQSLLKAKRIFIMGTQSSASLAAFLNFNLCLFFSDVHMIQTASTNEAFEQMLDINQDDVLFAITYPRYSMKIVNASSYAKSEGATVISLTDSMEAPVAPHSNYVLTAQSNLATFADSLTAPISVLNAIVVALVVHGKREELEARLNKLETLWEQYNVYAKQ